MLVLSLIFASRDTVAGFQDTFDQRIIHRAMRDARRFRISTLLWLTAYVAFSIAVIRFTSVPFLTWIVIPLAGVMLLLFRIAIASVFDRRVRRLPDTPVFPADDCRRDSDPQE
ncbi:hypothetical protein [Rhodopirellula bahusiensis]|uniref:hypothetical protein n=1 Tax=Rhodopirellula bahusiensis TaxID=2014065 RepID=UPI003264D341